MDQDFEIAGYAASCLPMGTGLFKIKDDSDDESCSTEVKKCLNFLKTQVIAAAEKIFHFYLTLNFTTRTNEFTMYLKTVQGETKQSYLAELHVHFIIFDNLFLSTKCLSTFDDVDKGIKSLTFEDALEIEEKAIEIEMCFLSVPPEYRYMLRQYSLIFITKEDRIKHIKTHFDTLFRALLLKNSLECNNGDAAIMKSIYEVFGDEKEQLVMSFSSRIFQIYYSTVPYQREKLMLVCLNKLKISLTEAELEPLLVHPVGVHPAVFKNFLEAPVTLLTDTYLNTHPERREHLLLQFLFLISNPILQQQLCDLTFQSCGLTPNICSMRLNFRDRDVLNRAYYRTRVIHQFKQLRISERQELTEKAGIIFNAIYSIKYPARKHVLQAVYAKINSVLHKEKHGVIDPHREEPPRSPSVTFSFNAYPRRLQDTALLKVAAFLEKILQRPYASLINYPILERVYLEKTYEESRPMIIIDLPLTSARSSYMAFGTRFSTFTFTVNSLRNIALYKCIPKIIQLSESLKLKNEQKRQETPLSTAGMKGNLELLAKANEIVTKFQLK